MSQTPETRAFPEPEIRILYTNHRDETAVRRIVPKRVWFGRTDWHPEPQWLLEAFDLDRQAVRSYALKEIRSFF